MKVYIKSYDYMFQQLDTTWDTMIQDIDKDSITKDEFISMVLDNEGIHEDDSHYSNYRGHLSEKKW